MAYFEQRTSISLLVSTFSTLHLRQDLSPLSEDIAISMSPERGNGCVKIPPGVEKSF